MTYKLYHYFNPEQAGVKKELRKRCSPSETHSVDGVPSFTEMRINVANMLMGVEIKIPLKVGTALCSHKDQFSRKIGRDVADRKATSVDYRVATIALVNNNLRVRLRNDSGTIIAISYNIKSEWPRIERIWIDDSFLP